MDACHLCGLMHFGSLVFATEGFRTLFVSDWEACCIEPDLDFQLRNQLPLIKAPQNLARFIEMANSTK